MNHQSFVKPERILLHNLQHSALEYPTVDDLLSAYSRMKELKIEPVLGINHGGAISFYYLDPHGNCIELFTEDFDPCKKLCAKALPSRDLMANSIDAFVDPEKMMTAWQAGASVEELLRRACAGEFAPSKPIDPKVLIQLKVFALKATNTIHNKDLILRASDSHEP